jgi:hypothetical protein
MNTAFEGDTFIKEELIKLRDKFGLTSCIETGTQYGSTTIELHSIFETVTTIEADEDCFFKAQGRLLGLKVEMYLGVSELVLRKIKIPDNVLYYLDAHGGEPGGCPLKEELEIIASKNHKNVCIAIHDFKNPNHPEFGFDTFDYELCYEEIEPYLKKIYRDGFGYHYNEEADGARQGIFYGYPKQKVI